MQTLFQTLQSPADRTQNSTLIKYEIGKPIVTEDPLKSVIILPTVINKKANPKVRRSKLYYDVPEEGISVLWNCTVRIHFRVWFSAPSLFIRLPALGTYCTIVYCTGDALFFLQALYCTVLYCMYSGTLNFELLSTSRRCDQPCPAMPALLRK